MTTEQIEQKAEKYVNKEVSEPNDYNEPVRIALKDGYIAGAKMLLETEEWKNLYAEGIEMGRKIERSIQTGKPIEE
jgi:hypothetical protein